MDVLVAIHGRRTIYDFDFGRPVERDTLEACLDAGRWGQNHKLSEPWRFCVVGPVTRERVAALLYEHKAAKAQGKPEEKAAAIRAKAEKKAQAMRELPALVVVSMRRTPDDAFREREDYAAVATGVQNIALALWAHGMGMQWGTGKVTRDPRTYEVLGIDGEAEEIVGFLKIGYPTAVPEPRRRALSEVLRELP